MILACQKLLGQITKVLGMRRPHPPYVGKNSQIIPYFFYGGFPKWIICKHTFYYFLGNKKYPGIYILRGEGGLWCIICIRVREALPGQGLPLQIFSKIILLFSGRAFCTLISNRKLLFLDSCKLFVKERKTTPINHSAGSVEWKWFGRVKSDWWAVKKTAGSDKCGYHLNENADDWTWKIQNFFWEKSNAAPKEELISLVCKCR